MNKKKKIALIIIAIFICMYFIRVPVRKATFGFYAGECIDSCQVVYSVSKYRITKDIYSEPSKSYDSIKSIAHYYIEEDHDGSFNEFKPWIPLMMILLPDGRIGCPDCNDQGGIILGFEVMGMVKWFYVDPDKIPNYYFNLREDLSSYSMEIDNEIKKYKNISSHSVK